MKILIVEDNERVSTLLKRGLETQAYETSVVEDGMQALGILERQSFDLVITDILLPHLDGISLCKALKSKNPQLPVIMLTALGTTDEKIQGFDAGADDYMVKPFELRELYARIKVVLKRTQSTGSIPEVSSILSYADLSIELTLKTVKRGDVDVYLTPKEFKLLVYLLQNKERVVSRTELAENVWDTYFDTGTNFIDVYINYLRKKIDKNFDGKLIHTKSGMGFIVSNKL